MLLALRNLAAHRVKSGIVGLILSSCTFLVVSGGALFDSIEAATVRSVTGSLAGDLQVFSADAEDELALFGGFGMGTSDIGELPDIARVEAALGSLPEVRTVVPMGTLSVTTFAENEIDRVLGDLRQAVAAEDAAGVASGRVRMRALVATIAADHEARVKIQAGRDAVAAERAAIARASSEPFWAGFDADPLGGLDFLEANIAPLAADGRVLNLRAIGTDPAQFTRAFDRFHMVDGQEVPVGRRGFLFSKRTYERVVKDKVARELDELFDARKAGARFAQDPLLQERAGRLSRQYARILFQIDPTEATVLLPKLRALLPGVDGELPALLQALLNVDDATIEARHAFFYAELAPMVRLYEIPVGGTITLRAYTRTGYGRSVTVPVWGTYDFEGLEKSDLVGALNLLDLVTWRELYGKMSADQQAELSGIKAEVGVVDVDAASLEDALFGEVASGAGAAEAVASTGFDEFARVDLSARRQPDTLTLDPAQLHQGLALHAAVLLHDPAQAVPVAAKIRALSEREDLGIQVVGWQGATGMIGQLLVVLHAVLYAAISAMFLVAVILINNTMVAATMERVGEIGVMRAIGALRSFVLGMFLVETVALAGISGAIGAGLAALFVGCLGRIGVPAPADVFVLVFAGPRLYPTLSWANLAFGITTILGVSVLSALYPAVLATRVAPIVALQGRE